MLYATSTRSRQVVGRFEKGDSLPDALLRLCHENEISAGQIRAQGILAEVELGIFDHRRGIYEVAFSGKGSFELLSLTGNVSMMGRERIVNAHATVAYMAHGQSHVVGGQLRGGKVHAVEFIAQVFDDLEVQSAFNAQLQLPAIKAITLLQSQEPEPVAAAPKEVLREEPPAEKPSKPTQRPDFNELERRETSKPATARPAPAPVSEDDASTAKQGRDYPTRSDWAAAAAKSQEILADADDDDELDELQPGDILLHPKLGECTVVRVEDDTAAYIRIRKSRRVSKLVLSVVRLEFSEERNGHKVYRVRAGS